MDPLLRQAPGTCQSEANTAEAAAIEKYRPNLIVWGSTEEHGSIFADVAGKSTVLTSGTSQWRALMRDRISARGPQVLVHGANVILLLEPAPVHGGNQVNSN